MQRIFIKICFLFTFGSVCRVKLFTARYRNEVNVSVMTKMLKQRHGSG
jgi:hypothetical protein